MRYMTTPKYHRDRLLRVASFPSHGIADGGLPLLINVNEDRVELYAAGYWSCPDVSPLVYALREAEAIAAQWTERDRALARVMDRRKANSRWWVDDVEGVLHSYRGELATRDKLDEIRACVEEALKKVKTMARGCPSVFPRIDIQLDEAGAALTYEPLWDEIEEFRWVEPDAS